MIKMIADVTTWLLDHNDQIIRYLVYKRIFTPYEEKQAYMDETEFESSHYSFGKIEEAINLGGGEWLIGIRNLIDDELVDSISYYRLSELRISIFSRDQYQQSD